MKTIILRKFTGSRITNASSYHLWVIIILSVIILTFYQFDFTFFINKPDIFWLIRLWEYKYHLTGIFLFLPFVYAAVAFRWKGTLYTWLICMIIMVPRLWYSNNNLTSFLYNIMFLTAPLAPILLVVFTLNWVKRERQINSERETERRSYTTQLLKAHEDESKRIAQELHDDPIQTLVALANRTQALLDRENNHLSPQVIKQLELIRDSVFSVSENLRRLSLSLRPSILDNIGLIEAIRWSVDNFEDKNVKAELQVKGDYQKLNPDNEVFVFRFIQEALNNVKHHAQASEVLVKLEFDTDKIKLNVTDNGRGFNVPRNLSKLVSENKLGLIGMQERAKMLNGNFDISSQPGAGTSILLEFKNEIPNIPR